MSRAATILKDTVHTNIILVFLAIVLVGCSNNDTLPAASFGDVTVLEKLAESYEKVSEQFPMNPQKLRQNDRMKFVENVFKGAGYSYSKTLLSPVVRQDMQESKHHRDLAELVLLPTKGFDDESLADLFDTDEMTAIAALEASLKK